MTKTLTSIVMTIALSGTSYAGELKVGQRYKLIKPIYLTGVYVSLNNRTISKDTAQAYLESKRYYKKASTAFQIQVPSGTIITIVGPAPKAWYLIFSADSYYIRMDPDLSQGLDVKLQLDRGIEGSLDGLNPEIFSRI